MPGSRALSKRNQRNQINGTEFIPFNRPYATGKELAYIAEAQRKDHLSGNGCFTKRCHQTGWVKALQITGGDPGP